MPPKPNRKAQSKNSQDWNKFEFVNINLSKEAAAEFKAAYAKDPQSLLNEADGLNKSGYKMSFTWDEDNHCTIASLTCRNPDDPNFNYIMTARAPDLWQSLALALYKHMFLCDDGDWGGDTEQIGRSFG